MINFHNDEDKALFLFEVGKNPLQGDTDTPDDHRLFVKKRKRAVSLLKDFNKSNAAKRAWGRGKNKYLFAIQQFSRSKEGRKFHRQLSRFLSTKEVIPRSGLFGESQLGELCDWISEELTYYHDVLTQAFLEWILEEISEV